MILAVETTDMEMAGFALGAGVSYNGRHVGQEGATVLKGI